MCVHSVFKADPVKQTEPGHRRIERWRDSLRGEGKGNITRGRGGEVEKRGGKRRTDEKRRGQGKRVSRIASALGLRGGKAE